MNLFLIQSFSSTKGQQFRNKHLGPYPQLKRNGYISSVGGNNMLRYSNQTIGSYCIAPQNSKPLPENLLQFGPASSQLFNYAGISSGSNPIGQYSLHPVNVFSEKGKGLVEFPCQTNFVASKNYLTRDMNPSTTKAESQVKNFTKSPYGANINHTRLLDVFNQNFSLSSWPTALDVHDRKRKKTASDEGVVVQNSYSLLNTKGNKKYKPTCKVWNEHKKYVINSNTLKNDHDGREKCKIVIQEDENGMLRVLSGPLLESRSLRKDIAGINVDGGNNTKACSVDNASKPADLDLTLHL